MIGQRGSILKVRNSRIKVLIWMSVVKRDGRDHALSQLGAILWVYKLSSFPGPRLVPELINSY